MAGEVMDYGRSSPFNFREGKWLDNNQAKVSGTGYVVAIGDSITYGQGNGSSLRQRDDWFQQFCARTRQQVRYGGIFATSGFTLTQIRDTHLPSVIKMNPKPSACFIFGGTNDVGAGGYNQEASLKVLDDIVSTLRAYNIIPVLVALLPRNDAADTLQNKWNVGLRTYANKKGLYVLEMAHSLLTSLSVRDASLYTDNVHPNVAGHTAMSKKAATDPLVNQFVKTQFTSKLSGDSTNLIPSGFGLFGTDTDANGLGDGWSAVGSLITFSRVAPIASEDVQGQWQRIVRAVGGTTGTCYQQLINTGFSVGDTLAFSGRFRTSGIEGTTSMYTIQGAWQGVAVQNLEPIFNWTKDVSDGAFYVEGTVPAGATGIMLQVIMTVPTSGTPQLDLAEVTLTNLTTSGAYISI